MGGHGSSMTDGMVEIDPTFPITRPTDQTDTKHAPPASPRPRILAAPRPWPGRAGTRPRAGSRGGRRRAGRGSRTPVVVCWWFVYEWVVDVFGGGVLTFWGFGDRCQVLGRLYYMYEPPGRSCSNKQTYTHTRPSNSPSPKPPNFPCPPKKALSPPPGAPPWPCA